MNRISGRGKYWNKSSRGRVSWRSLNYRRTRLSGSTSGRVVLGGSRARREIALGSPRVQPPRLSRGCPRRQSRTSRRRRRRPWQRRGMTVEVTRGKVSAVMDMNDNGRREGGRRTFSLLPPLIVRIAAVRRRSIGELANNIYQKFTESFADEKSLGIKMDTGCRAADT